MKTTVLALGKATVRVVRFLLIAGIVGLAAFPFGVAYAAVTVSLTAPSNGAVFNAPANITLSATASATQGFTVSKVEFFYGGTNLIGTDTTSPYSFIWTNVAAGAYTLTAKATAIKKNNPDQTATSAPVSITVNVLPTVSMTSPSGGAVFAAPGAMTLTATASDADGTIQKVEFFHGGTNLIATVTSAPYTYAWSGVAAGSYSLTAKATDNQNAATTSSPVAVTVTNPPSVTLTSPANNAIYSAPANVTLTATASDTDGIQKVEFFHGGTNLIATVTTSPYTYAWTNVAIGTYSLTAKATDNLGIATTSSPANITVSSLAPAGLYYIHPDHLNTPRAIYNDQQQLAWRWDQQEPFGNSPPNENPAGIGTFEFPLRFPGQYADKETNLNYNYFRDYDPGIGRYGESDPIGLDGGLNTFVYVGGKPLRFGDFWGLDNPGMGSYGPYWSPPFVTYNRPPPWTVAVNPGVEAQVQCMMMCLGKTDDPSWPPPEKVVVSGGAETQRHVPPSRGGRHHVGEAVDFGQGANPRVAAKTGRKNEANDCACKCKFSHGGWEPDWKPQSAPHYHFQNGAGAGVPSLNCGSC